MRLTLPRAFELANAVGVPSVILERESYCQLYLPRIADTLPQEAVEIKQARRGQRILISAGRQRVNSVIRVKGIEHLHRGNQRVAFAETEGS